jgi:hypothetical protein
MNIDTFQTYFDLPYGSLPHLDKYINYKYLAYLGKTKRIKFKDIYKIGDLRFITVKGSPRTLIGSSAAVQRNKDKTGQLFLCSHTTAMAKPTTVMPRKGWRASSADSMMYKGIFKPKTKFKSPKNIGWDNARINTCIYAGLCKGPCLRMTGNMQLPTSSRSRYLKTWFLYTEPLAFLRKLVQEIQTNSLKCNNQKQKYYLRLNGMSDIEWERYLYIDVLQKETKGLYGFYDYTKHPIANRVGNAHKIPGGVSFPKKYKIIYSWDEKKKATERAVGWLRYGAGLSVVYPYSQKEEVQKLRKKFRFLISGDEDDNRFKDRANSIVLLKNKGDLKEENGALDNSQSHLITPLPVLHSIIDAVQKFRKRK